MTRRIFVDTGAWLALADSGDDQHDVAVRAYRELLMAGNRLITTNLIIAETYNLIRRRIGHSAAMLFLQSLRDSPRLEKIFSDPRLETTAEALLRRYVDQDFSYVDAVSFAVMQAEEVPEAFAFDRHFRTAGFALVP